MKRIGILTFQKTHNYGALLQAYALCTKISQFNNNCSIINYYSPYFKKIYGLTPRKNNLINFFKNMITLPKEINKYFKFNSFRKYLNLTEPVCPENLIKLNDKFDIFIVGSDQVWNEKLQNNDLNYFLNFVQDNKKKVAYSASFGINFLNEYQQSRYKPLLSSFSKISVREKQAQDIMRNLLNINVLTTLDPTLLLNISEWKKIAILPKTDNYILLYLVHHDKKIINFTYDLAKEKNLRILFISPNIIKKIKAEYIFPTPQEFVGYFLKAKYIVTNSFHGTCFSINFNKTFFIDLLPKENASVNSRLENILDIFHLKNRLIDNIQSFPDKEINFKNTNKILFNEREKSINYLKEFII